MGGRFRTPIADRLGHGHGGLELQPRRSVGPLPSVLGFARAAGSERGAGRAQDALPFLDGVVIVIVEV